MMMIMIIIITITILLLLLPLLVLQYGINIIISTLVLQCLSNQITESP